ncbi:MAG: hypothetical protein ACTHML_10870 [Ginsengibacter sp.]
MSVFADALMFSLKNSCKNLIKRYFSSSCSCNLFYGLSQEQPDRNYPGVGSLFLLINKNREASFLCDDCARGGRVFGEVERFVQMELF